MTRRFPAPWSVERIEGGFKVLDDTGQALAYVYFRTSAEHADAAKALAPDEARRIAANIAKLPEFLSGKAQTAMSETMIDRWKRDLKQAEDQLERLSKHRLEYGHEGEVADWESRASHALQKIEEETKRLSDSGQEDIEGT